MPKSSTKYFNFFSLILKFIWYYKLIGWDLEWHCNETYGVKETSEEMISEIDTFFDNKRTKVENHLVLLTHDQFFRDSLSIKELEKFINTLKKRDDIELAQIHEYPEIADSIYF